jgi:hypothetical protein
MHKVFMLQSDETCACSLSKMAPPVSGENATTGTARGNVTRRNVDSARDAFTNMGTARCGFDMKSLQRVNGDRS